MKDPYENILIGNFLYSLGLVIGRRFPDKPLPGVVNLLQQTPLDGPLGDVLLRYPGVIRLIEFKRASNDSDKESDKLDTLKLSLENEPALQQVSRAIHWYVESSKGPLDWRTRVCPYLDFAGGQSPPLDFQAFTQSLAETVGKAQAEEFPDALIQRYLDAVAAFSGKSGTSSSGLLVSVGQDGTLHYIALESIRELRQELQVHRQQADERSASIAQERALEHKPQGKGLSL
ncbi:hypothetical protein [Acidovorax sp. BLS4]|uniref:hypothetical protein n=1 Tax=Acidovorax sp. BLS4 TaxID=3273430 RepID=UPI0029430CC0|nr:hypothetical protein [Paracidovorax avenae]WOI47894.1 hypothetical protein R1Z03_12045 [Paracidovorax avenae]